MEVQPRGRLVEHVQRVAGLDLAELAAELDALGLAAAHGRRGLADLHVAEADVLERRQDPMELAVILEQLGGSRRRTARARRAIE